jgi:hypothetical protein
MPWTVGCFCGQTFTAPPMRCPHCASPAAGPHRAPPAPRHTRQNAHRRRSRSADAVNRAQITLRVPRAASAGRRVRRPYAIP